MKAIYLLVSLLGCASCVSGPKVRNEADEIPVLHVNGEEVKKTVSFDSLFKKTTVIPLETTPSSLIKRVGKVVWYKSNIYILDDSQKRLLQFDATGNFVRSIEHLGQGPGEYLSLADFQIKDDKIYLLDRYGARLLVYGMDDVLLSVEPIKKAVGIDVLDDGYALNLELGTADGSIHKSYFSYSHYSDRSYTDNAAPFNKHLLGLSFSLSEGSNAFYHFNDSAFCIFPFNDTIYTVSRNGKAFPYRIINIGDMKISLDDGPDRIKKLREHGISTSVFAYYKLCGGYTLFSYYYGEQSRKYVLADSDNNIIFNTSLGLDIDKLPVRIISHETDLEPRSVMSLVYPFEIIGLVKKYPESDVLTNLAEKLDDESNPVLIFYSFDGSNCLE